MGTDKHDLAATPQEERRRTEVEREEPRPERSSKGRQEGAPQSGHTAPGYENKPGAGEDEGEDGRKRPDQEPGDAAARENKDG